MKDVIEFIINPRNFVVLAIKLVIAAILHIYAVPPIVTIFIPVVAAVYFGWWCVGKVRGRTKAAPAAARPARPKAPKRGRRL